ncbi:MAG TPA: cytochrome c [Roseiarcus sp.]|jgi:mono/diheme cytochrome c family protein
MMRTRPSPCDDDRAFWSPRSTVALSLAAFFILGTAAPAQEPPSKSPTLSSGWVFNERGGAALYANICAACHQPDAMGAIGAGAYPSLAGNEKLASAGYLETVLLHGLRGMPAVGRMMSDEQAADVINYVRTHFGNSYDDAISAADIKAAR